MTPRELLQAMYPEARSRWNLCDHLAPVFNVAVTTVYRWLDRGEMPPNAKLIAQLYVGEVTLSDLEDMIQNAT